MVRQIKSKEKAKEDGNKWGTVTVTESGTTQPKRKLINNTKKSNWDLDTRHVLSSCPESRRHIVFFCFVFEVEEKVEFYIWFTPGEFVELVLVQSVSFPRQWMLSKSPNRATTSLSSHRRLQTHNGAMLASARGKQETWRLGKVRVHSRPWLKVGKGQRLEGGAGNGVELLH